VSSFVLDTNVLSELIKAKPDAKVVQWIEATNEAILFLSVLALGEIRNRIARLPSEARQRRLKSWLRVDLQGPFQGRILPINDAIADRWGAIPAAAAAMGKPLPVVDGLRAATALYHELMLTTGNGSDVAATGVSVLNPGL
jgi:predicted nucleic acid-binding protein